MKGKIFTMIAGALLLLGAVAGASAQDAPRTPYDAAHKSSNLTNAAFYDILRADVVPTLPGKEKLDSRQYVLGVTGVANATGGVAKRLQVLLDTAAAHGSLSESFVLFVNGESDAESKYLAIESLASLDTLYSFFYDGDAEAKGRHSLGHGSYKFGAMRRSLWCVQYNYTPSVTGSNITYFFRNMETGKHLAVPIHEKDNEFQPYGHAPAGTNQLVYGRSVDNEAEELNIVDEWKFSHSFAAGQRLQVNMPLFSYVTRDTVEVLVLLDTAYSVGTPVAAKNGYFNRVSNEGGYRVTTARVAVNDLLLDAQGNVRLAPAATNGGKYVPNVLLFTLKKLMPFVMNADDWNAVHYDVTFNPDANQSARSENARIGVKGDKGAPLNYTYINPFSRQPDGAPLLAQETADDLYHWGYMQFRVDNTKKTGANSPLRYPEWNWLFVDTGYVNTADGVNLHVAFNLYRQRSDTLKKSGVLEALAWGEGWPKAADGTMKPDGWMGEEPDMVSYHRAAYEATDCGKENGLADTIWTERLVKTNMYVQKLQDEGVAELMAYYEDPGTYEKKSVDSVLLVIPDWDTFSGDPDRKSEWDEYFGAPSDTSGRLHPDDRAGMRKFPSLYPSPKQQRLQYRAAGKPGHIVRCDYKPAAVQAQYLADSVSYLVTYKADSIMENQSKFRVVYDPFEDSTYINVYQSRMRYPDYTDSRDNAKYGPWWENSFYFNPDGKLVSPMDTLNALGVDMDTLFKYDVLERMWSDVAMPFSDGSDSVWGHGAWNDIDTALEYGSFGSLPSMHSFKSAYQASIWQKYDKVMVSTADTMVLDTLYKLGPLGLSHIYGASVDHNGAPYYRDSLLYVDIQDLNGQGKNLLTLNQAYVRGEKRLNTQVMLGFGDRCKYETPESPYADVESDLVLIRNRLGEYLAVPVWSASDSVYWVTPEEWEDPTRMPSYQWAIVRETKDASNFRMVNREFEGVEFEYVKVYRDDYKAAPHRHFVFAGGPHVDASFNRKDIYSGWTKVEEALPQGNTEAALKVPFKSETFVGDIEAKFPRSSGVTFIRLGKDVKEDQLLGYKYVDKDEAYVNVYALKYNHAFARGDKARYVSWNGKDNPEDSSLYVKGDIDSRLYFEVQEMRGELIAPYVDGRGMGTKLRLTKDMSPKDMTKNTYPTVSPRAYQPLYDQLTSKEHLYWNTDSVVMERFGYYEENYDGKAGVWVPVIEDLRPLARQAYRLLWKDHYKWNPAQSGSYVTVGDQDRYVLSGYWAALWNSMNYNPETDGVTGLFGIPHFYFRNTYFDVERPADDYFALVQRLDTATWAYRGLFNDYAHTGMYDLDDYLTRLFGSSVAAKVIPMFKNADGQSELGVLFAHVVDATARLNSVYRGDGQVRVSGFQLAQDNDPIYRRFHVNEPKQDFFPELGDMPDTLEFHLLNDGVVGGRLYENYGAYQPGVDVEPVPWNERIDKYTGGRVYNLDKNYMFKRDSLTNVLSFLGINNDAQYGSTTNYAFYMDTAYINRGTGWLKPQYMFVVDPYLATPRICEPKTGDRDLEDESFLVGRYMYNGAMYAKKNLETRLAGSAASRFDVASQKFEPSKSSLIVADNYSKVEPIYANVVKYDEYIWDGKWERLAFSWAIHDYKNDRLIVLKGEGLEPWYNNSMTDPEDVVDALNEAWGVRDAYHVANNIDFDAMIDSCTASAYEELYWPKGPQGAPEIRKFRSFKSSAALKSAKNPMGLGVHAVIDLGDNTHKDWVFSFRYVERGSSDFVIESETTDRQTWRGPVILPVEGGWVKYQNGVPVITRTSWNYGNTKKPEIGEAAGSVFNVHRPDGIHGMSQDPVGNESLGAVRVLGGVGSVTVLNGSGRKAVVSDMLGRTVLSVVLESDNATLQAPSGVVVVSVEGEAAVKAVVK